jgi:hypothetical protein
MENKPKRELRRSNAYPSISIRDAIDLTDFVQRNSGHSFLKLEDIAKLTNKSVGGMSQKVGSAVQYGLLELKSGTGYRPSELYKKITKPVNESEKHLSLIEAFKSPKLYVELISRFSGSALPSEVILPNILERDHSVFDDAAKKAAQIFLENVDFLGLKTSHNELNLSVDQTKSDSSDGINTSLSEASFQKTKTASSPLSASASDLLKIEIGLTDDKKAIIFYPKDLTEMDIELMKLQISVLEKLVEFNKKPEQKVPA